LKFDLCLWIALCNVCASRFAFSFISTGKENLRAFLRENADSFQSVSTIRSGNNRNASGSIWNIFFTPRPDYSSFNFGVSLIS